ncbi:Altered inheritance of mitochondria protein 24 [Entamoeba marina]
MDGFILAFENENNNYAVLRVIGGILRVETNDNIQPTVFHLERVTTRDRGFLLKSENQYFYRCRHGPIVQCEREYADIFEYSLTDKLLYIERDKEKFVCVLRDNALIGDEVLRIDWSTLCPSTIVSEILFTFCITTHPHDRTSRSLYLSPGKYNENVVLRQGLIGEEILVWKRSSNPDDHTLYLSRGANGLILVQRKDKAEKFCIKNDITFLQEKNRSVPLCAGEQSVKGFELSFPTTFINFHPL